MELDELIQQAEGTGQMLWCRYQDLWFTPQKLRQENANGKFRWGAQNFALRDPAERTAQLERAVQSATAKLEAWQEKIAAPSTIQT